MQAAFAHQQPELETHSIPLARLRRTQLFKMAVEKKLIPANYPTPTKDTLISIVSGQLVLPPEMIQQMEKPKSVPLNEAHLEPQPTFESTAPVNSDSETLANAAVLDVEDDADLFGEEEETSIQAYERLSLLNLPALKKALKEDFDVTLPRTTTKVTALNALKAQLGLEMDADADQNTT